VSPRVTVAISCVGFLMVVLDTTVVTVALPAIEGSLGGGISGSQWIVDAHALTFGALVLSAGQASDRIRASLGFAIGVAVFAVSSALCAPGHRCSIC
jgi:DHA2 family methylenomycin A resistance protein-like MFS transporter